MTARERIERVIKDCDHKEARELYVCSKCLDAALIAHGEGVKEEALHILRAYLAAYPESIFLPPPPGEHGRTVDGCSAAALRAVLPNIIKDVDAIEIEVS